MSIRYLSGLSVDSTVLVVDTVNDRVGIGTASPNRLLQVAGSVYINTNLDVVGTIFGSTNKMLDQSATYTRLYDAAGTLVVSIGSGNVGIGTTAPSYKLHVVDSSNETVAKFSGPNDTTIIIGGSDLGSGEKYITYQNNTTGTDAWMVGMDDDETFRFAYGAAGEITDANAKMIILQTGNVGIGTTAPGYRLHVKDSANVGTIAIGHDLYPVLLYSDAGSGEFRIDNRASSSSGYITFYPNGQAGTIGSEAMRITSDGTLMVGTTSQTYNNTTYGYVASFKGAVTTQAYLSVALSNQTPTSQGMLFGLTSTTGDIYVLDNKPLVLYTNSTEKMRITAGGNVGIGATAPGDTLELYKSSGPGLRFNGNNANLYNIQNTAGLQIATYNGPIKFSIGTSPQTYDTNVKVTIDTSGNVGIGTTSPSSKLHISGSSAQLLIQGDNYSGIHQAYAWVTNTYFGARYDGTNEVYGATGRGAFKIVALHDADNDPQYLAFYGANAGTAGSTITWNTVGFAQDEDGNVGIGTTGPTEKLHVDGSTLITYNNSFQSTNSVGNKAILARVSPTSGIVNYAEYATATNLNGFVIGSDDARVKGNIATDSLEFITNTSTRMTILSGGNVGINTTVPGSTLHVVGDVLIQTGALGVGVNPNATDGRIDASNDIVAFSTSDRRLKENITPIANALEKVRSLTGVEFDWKEETKSVHGYEGHDVGVIAQDVQAVLPEAVRTNDSGYLSVRYEKMIALLVEANKELADRVEQLEKLIK